MVAVDPLEQLNADRLDLIGADAGGHRRPGRIEIAIEERLGQRPHGQAGDAPVLEQHVAAAYHRDGRVQLVCAAGERLELRAGGGAIRRLVEPAPAEFAYRLVSPLFEDQGLVVSAVADGDAVRVSCRDAAGRVTATGVIR